MLPHLLTPALVSVAAALSGDATPTSAFVEVRSAAPHLTAHALALAGFDVDGCGAATTATGVKLIATPEELDELRRRGHDVHVLERGRPMRDILAERAVDDGVPPAGYLDLAGVEAALAAYAAAHPTRAQLVDLTTRFNAPPTHLGRHLFALKVSDNVTLDEDEPAVLVVSAHHCREIVTPVIALDTIDRLLNGYATDAVIRAIVDANELWIVPVWNPDGYAHVFATDNLWRKNRRPFAGGTGVDLNRNYPFLWGTACGGSTSPANSTYRGPAPASEAETVTMQLLSADRHFAKVLDYHSTGRETLWGYACPTSPIDAFWQAEAVALSVASGYGGTERRPSADGEHYHWQFATTGAMAYLTETHTSFQPSFASATTEAALVWAGTRHLLQRPMPLAGHVRDACSGAPIAATIEYVAPAFTQGEANRSEPRFGRYHAFLPPGMHTLRFSAPGYVTATRAVALTAGATTTLDVTLDAAGGVGTAFCAATPSSTGLVPAVALVGSTSLAANALAVQANGLPALQPTTLLFGANLVAVPQFNGTLCIGRPLVRVGLVASDLLGNAQHALDLAAAQAAIGSTYGVQVYYRDPAAGGAQRNFTPGLSFTVCP